MRDQFEPRTRQKRLLPVLERSSQPQDHGSGEELEGPYWRDNMTGPGLFADAVKNAAASDDQLNLVLEVGPHPGLRGLASYAEHL